MKEQIQARLRAGGAHLAISVLVGGSALLLIYIAWYPEALSDLMDVHQVTPLLIAVDVALGPLLTLIVFDPRKPARVLGRDLAVIGTAQFVALVIGMSSIYTGRPVFLVFSVDSVTAVTRTELDEASWQKVKDTELAGTSLFGPKWVAAELPPPGEARNKLIFSSLSGGADLPQLPEYYRPYDDLTASIREKLQPISQLTELNPELQIDWQKRFGKPAEQLGHLPLVSMPREAAAIFDRASARPLAIINATPAWPSPSRDKSTRQ